MLIVTLPPVTRPDLEDIISHPQVKGVRYNVGMRTPFSPKDTLSKIFRLTQKHQKTFWVDLKGRQLRIDRWADPLYGEIILNHHLTVDLPATIVFRGGFTSNIIAVEGNKIFISPDPKEALGQGQAVNILGSNLVIDEYLTPTDQVYLQAAKELHIDHFMLSFVESPKDIIQVSSVYPSAKLVLKIESLPGVNFVEQFSQQNWSLCRLMLARDDLMVQLGEHKLDILNISSLVISRDPQAIAASHLLNSLQHGPVTAADISDLLYLRQLGFKSFLLSDTISHFYLTEALNIWSQLDKFLGDKT